MMVPMHPVRYDVSEGTQLANHNGLVGMSILWRMLLGLAAFSLYEYETGSYYTNLLLKNGFLGWAAFTGFLTIPAFCILFVTKTALEWPRTREIIVNDEGFTLVYTSGKELHRSWHEKGLNIKISDDRLLYPNNLTAIELKIPWQPRAEIPPEVLEDLLERASRSGVKVERKRDREIDGTIAGELLIFRESGD